MKKCFYITTTLPYINDQPHLGFAMEIVRADTIARFYRLLDFAVFFNTGSDEHGQKIYQKAKQLGMDPQKFSDQNVKPFKDLKKLLNLSYTHFIRTTDKNHIRASQEFWRRCQKNGDIYKASYKTKYCVGCELEKTDSELINNRCPIHPNQEIQLIEEENYFFRFSRYQKKLLEFYEKNPQFILPDFRQEELIKFVKRGLKDFSISRLKKKMPWGIEVPDDPNQVMYVWFDALINYISTLGWPENLKKFSQFWPGIQIAGKDNLRQQGAMWQAMLLSANLPLSNKIYIEGFITVNGQKMSKSLGNIINPFELVKQYGKEAVRYYLLREIPPFTDGDFSHQRMREIYNSELANELGNLVSRITRISEEDNLSINRIKKKELKQELNELKKFIDQFLFNEALFFIWNKIKKLNSTIDQNTPWKKAKKERKDFLLFALKELQRIAALLTPFLPETSEKISQGLLGKVKKISPLFPRLKNE